MTAQHTPGPWKVDWFVCREGGKELWRVARSIGPLSPEHDHWAGNHLSVDEADVRVIEAAPDLLEAAKMVLAWYEAEKDHKGTTFMQRVEMCQASEAAIRAALAKANGERP